MITFTNKSTERAGAVAERAPMWHLEDWHLEDANLLSANLTGTEMGE